MDVDLMSPEMKRDPYPIYEAVRREGEVVWNGLAGAWMIPNDRLCRKVMGNFSQNVVEGTTSAELFGDEAFIVIDDKKRHDDLRGVWETAFAAPALRQLQPRVEAMVDGLLAPMVRRLRDGETVEVVDAFCRDLPVLLISEMFGVAEAMRPSIIDWSDRLVRSLLAQGDVNTPEWLSGEEARRSLAAFLLDEISARRARPGEDLISRIVHSEVGGRLADEAIMVNCRQLLFAGNETTSRWLAQAIFVFGSHPRDLARVSADHGLLPQAMEEVMRWDSIAQILSRKVRGEPLELDGVTVRDGQHMLLLVGAANRDPERYADPARFDIDRTPKRHLGFGFGLHHCLGAALARLETGVAMPRFLAQVPDYALEGEVTYSNPMARSPDAVAIRLH